MGRVELAMRSESGFERLYAVKRLHPQLREDESFRTMFLDEARVAGRGARAPQPQSDPLDEAVRADPDAHTITP